MCGHAQVEGTRDLSTTLRHGWLEVTHELRLLFSFTFIVKVVYPCVCLSLLSESLTLFFGPSRETRRYRSNSLKLSFAFVDRYLTVSYASLPSKLQI